MKPPKGQLGRQGTGNQGMGQKGNSREGDLLKTNKRTMVKDSGLQAQSQIGVEVGNTRNPERLNFIEPNKYPRGLA